MTLVVAVLSQKGGVGKSTLARLVAASFAEAGWRVCLADLNVKQRTSADWAARRRTQRADAAITVEVLATPRDILRQRSRFDLIVFDGKPDSDVTSLDAARLSDAVLVPTGVGLDDLKPQVLFAEELVAKNVTRARISFVLNLVPDSEVAVIDARNYLRRASFSVLPTPLPHRIGYSMAQNEGGTLFETHYLPLNERAAKLAN